MSRENTNDDTGVKIVVNAPFTNERGSGQYTHKIYKLGRYFYFTFLIYLIDYLSKLPSLATTILPSSLFLMHEKAWNCYPYCRTGKYFIFNCLINVILIEYSVPALGERVSIIIETVHLPDNGSTMNVITSPPSDFYIANIVFLGP